MSTTYIKELEQQIQKFWSPILVPELKESAVLPTLVSKDYQGEIKQGGDTVYVSMVESALGATKTIDNTGNHTVISTEKLQTQRIGIVADKIFEASFELDNLIDLQSQLGNPQGQSAIRAALMKGIELQMNDYLYSLVAPSSGTPDHLVSGVSDYNLAAHLANRTLASKAKWAMNKPWYALLDPDYYANFLTETKNTSMDFVGNDLPLIGGQRPHSRAGFQILEDNSDAMRRLSPTGVFKNALIFHPDFMYMVMQQQASFKLSDLHSNKQRGYLLTVEIIGGAKLGIQGNVKHIVNYNA
jgi:hypothetical protein